MKSRRLIRFAKRFAAVSLLVCLLFTAAAAEDGASVVLTFAGDCTLGCQYSWFNAKNAMIKRVSENGYDYPFANVRELFASDDLTIVNLEGVLQDSNAGKRQFRKYNFRGPTDYVQILTQSSIEACSLGNNHSNDFGGRGVKSTRETLTSAGVQWFQDKFVYLYKKDGVKLAFLSFWSDDFNSHKKWLKTELPRLRAEEQVDYIVLCLHDGVEHQFKHREDVAARARYAVDCGADVVVGTHPHVLQGVEIYQNRLIVYSLGNFVFGGSRKFRENCMQTMLLRLTVNFADDGAFVSQQATLIPARVSGTVPENNYQPVLLTGEDAQDVIDLVQDDTPFPLPPYTEGQGAVLEPLVASDDT